MPQVQLAKIIGISRSKLASWESGKISTPAQPAMVSRWAKGLNVSETWLLGMSSETSVDLAKISTAVVHRVIIQATTPGEAVGKVARILARPGFDPWWETTPLIRDQARAIWLLEARYGVYGPHLKSLEYLAKTQGISPRRINLIVQKMIVRAERFQFVIPEFSGVGTTGCDLPSTEDIELFKSEVLHVSLAGREA